MALYFSGHLAPLNALLTNDVNLAFVHSPLQYGLGMSLRFLVFFLAVIVVGQSIGNSF